MKTSCFSRSLHRSVVSRAHASYFTYLYEAIASALGEVELENTVTWHAAAMPGCISTKLIFRYELEIGITDRLRLGVYPTDWAHRSDENSKFSYDDGALGLIYNLSNPRCRS